MFFLVKHVSGLLFAAVCIFPLWGMSESAFSAPVTSVAGLPDLASLVEKTGPAVVNIRTVVKIQRRNAYSTEAEQQFQEYLFRFFGIPQRRQGERSREVPEIKRGMGSGFIISSDGYIMTNTHVVEGADEVHVRLTDNREFLARIIGSDKRTDVALLRIEGENLPYLPLGKSAAVRAGEWVVAIGSPFALENTVTAGIISAKARETGDYLPLIQTDVAVNPGNSGGPLINLRGEVIGINSQIYSRSGGYMGISFAIPIDEAVRVSEQLKSSGKVVRGQIGVQISEISSKVAKELGVPEKQGVMVNKVSPGSSAEKGGVKAGDIILAFNGQAIRKINELPRMVGETTPGTRVNLTVWRNGSTRVLKLLIAAVDNEEDAGKPAVSPEERQGAASNNFGVTVGDLSAAQKKQLGVEGGVYVRGVSGVAAASDLRRGDIIVRVNDTDIHNARQFEKALVKYGKKKSPVLLVQREGMRFFVMLGQAQ
ncbi:MAG: Do family serine endopeptidase [Burkholderiaceae bacterium]|nr:Do family serine endopeptidase [Burkholderiaceae bacterium]